MKINQTKLYCDKLENQPFFITEYFIITVKLFISNTLMARYRHILIRSLYNL